MTHHVWEGHHIHRERSTSASTPGAPGREDLHREDESPEHLARKPLGLSFTNSYNWHLAPAALQIGELAPGEPEQERKLSPRP